MKEYFYLIRVSGTDADALTEEVGNIIDFVANGDNDIDTSTSEMMSEDKA